MTQTQTQLHGSPPPAPSGYFHRTQQPLTALLFLLPLIALYEAGVVWVGAQQDIVARHGLAGVFNAIGIGGAHLPGLIVVTLLLCWHVAGRYPWRVDLRLPAPMLIESCAWAVPLLMVMIVLARQAAAMPPDQASSPSRERAGERVHEATDFTDAVILQASPARSDAIHPPPAPPSREGGNATAPAASSTTITSAGHWPTQIVFSVGAGIYEELLFRLIAIAALHLLIVDLFKAPPKVGATLAVLISSAAFSLYHFSEANPFAWLSFAAYMIAGVYFALIYLGRGFGIAVGVHAMYDVFVVVLNQAQG